MAKTASKGSGAAIPKVEVVLEFTPEQGEALLETLQTRFEQNMDRHQGLDWVNVEAKLRAQPRKIASLYAMEQTGGEPDVVGFDETTGDYIYMDCAAETPEGRRNVCYNGKGQAEREKKGIYPGGNAVDLSADMGIALLTEEQYRELQLLGNFDTKTSSWVKTPGDIRKLGGALFCDRRYNHVFLSHNGAESYYAARGFRGMLKV